MHIYQYFVPYTYNILCIESTILRLKIAALTKFMIQKSQKNNKLAIKLKLWNIVNAKRDECNWIVKLFISIEIGDPMHWNLIYCCLDLILKIS